MATEPAFASTPNNSAGITPATLDTSLTAPTNVTTVFTAGSGGSKVEEIVLIELGTVVTGLLNIFLYDGATYHLYESLLISPHTVNTTIPSSRTTKTYANLVLKSGWSIRVTTTIAGNQSMHKVLVFGGDF